MDQRKSWLKKRFQRWVSLLDINIHLDDRSYGGQKGGKPVAKSPQDRTAYNVYRGGGIKGEAQRKGEPLESTGIL